MHELDMTKGRAAMAYVGAVPWHGLGQELTAGAPIEVWLKEAGMDFKVCRSRVRYGDGDNARIWDERHVLFRSDNKAPLGLVSDGYRIVQPGEVLEFFRDLCDCYDFQLETAGVLFNGARYWALAKIPQSLDLGDDKVNRYLLLATSADGSMATSARDVATRVVCNNTLVVSMGERSKHAVTVRHSTTFDACSIKVDMGLLKSGWDEFAGKAERLAAAKLTKRQALNILIGAIGDNDKWVEAQRAGKPVGVAIDEQPNKRAMATILDLYQGRGMGARMASADGTAWGLINAATEYYDHHAGRSDRNPALASAWFGPAANAKRAVYETALTYTVDAPSGPHGTLDAVIAATPVGK